VPESTEEVRYYCLRPAQAVARREALPVAWLPLGVLEWHGVQNPLGLDALKAEGLLCRAAGDIGGLVMPTLYWGDHRRPLAEVVFDPAVSDWFPSHLGNQTEPISREMRLPREQLVREADRLDRSGGWRLWIELVTNILFQIESLGFRCIAAYAGHAPLWTPFDQTAEAYRRQGGAAEVMRLSVPGGEDHAAVRETSLMLALCPGLADLSELDPSGARHIGILGDDPLAATAELGHQLADQFVAEARRQVAAWQAAP
jgi:creatinine amidohydrolase